MALNLGYYQSCYSPRSGNFGVIYEGRRKEKQKQKDNLPRLGAEELKIEIETPFN